jgi:hypothetical protein
MPRETLVKDCFQLAGAWRIEAVAHLHDPNGAVQQPQRNPDLFQAKAAVNVYEPADHFTRKIVIPNVRFQDWTADFTRK